MSLNELDLKSWLERGVKVDCEFILDPKESLGPIYRYQFLKVVHVYRKFLRQHTMEQDPIGFWGDKNIESYALFIAILFEERIAVPLSRSDPHKRIESALTSLDVRMVFGIPPEGSHLNMTQCKMNLKSMSIEILHQGESGLEASKHKQKSVFLKEKVAYILFTSGSTGKPKSVYVGTNQVAVFLKNALESLQIEERKKWSQIYEWTFDLALGEILMAWVTNGCLVLSSKVRLPFLQRDIIQHRIQYLSITPSMGRWVWGNINSKNEYQNEEMSQLKKIFFCGERLELDLVQHLLKISPATEIYNLYGPTEATIFFSSYKINADELDLNICKRWGIPIGRPMGQNQFEFKNSVEFQVEPQSSDKASELMLIGPQVALTYGDIKNDSDARQDVLRMPNQEKIVYSSGDFVFQDQKTGNIYFLSRNDEQIKINGYRLDLRALEHLAKETFSMPFMKVIYIDEARDSTQILQESSRRVESRDEKKKYLGQLIFVCSQDLNPMQISDLSGVWKRILPQWAIPKWYVVVNDLPLNSNGKLDLKDLILRIHWNEVKRL